VRRGVRMVTSGMVHVRHGARTGDCVVHSHEKHRLATRRRRSGTTLFPFSMVKSKLQIYSIVFLVMAHRTVQQGRRTCRRGGESLLIGSTSQGRVVLMTC
jgi:hypothetical protein